MPEIDLQCMSSGIRDKRKLPVRNKTDQKESDRYGSKDAEKPAEWSVSFQGRAACKGMPSCKKRAEKI